MCNLGSLWRCNRCRRSIHRCNYDRHRCSQRRRSCSSRHRCSRYQGRSRRCTGDQHSRSQRRHTPSCRHHDAHGRHCAEFGLGFSRGWAHRFPRQAASARKVKPKAPGNLLSMRCLTNQAYTASRPPPGCALENYRPSRSVFSRRPRRRNGERRPRGSLWRCRNCRSRCQAAC